MGSGAPAASAEIFADVIMQSANAAVPVVCAHHPQQNKQVSSFLIGASPILENALPLVKNGKNQEVQHKPTCVFGSKTGRTQSNMPVDHFGGLARTSEPACAITASGGMSERTALESSVSLITESSLLLPPENTMCAGGAVAEGGGGGGGGDPVGLSQLTVWVRE